MTIKEFERAITAEEDMTPRGCGQARVNEVNLARARYWKSKLRLTWKKQPAKDRWTGGETGYDLRQNGETRAHVRPLMAGGWFWYTLNCRLHNNTASSPAKTVGEAKAQAMEFVKAAL